MNDEIAPGFLIAVPQLMDGNFHRTVVFLLEHNAQGAFGLVINRPSQMKVRDLLKTLDIDPGEGDPDARVLVGGPVQPETGLVLHTDKDFGEESRRVTESIFVASTPASLRRLVARGSSRVLCFAGYAGWGPGQLERELNEGSWIIAPADDSLLFAQDRGGLWEKALRKLGIDPRFIVSGGAVS
jgi:putative transcriptional regulator